MKIALAVTLFACCLLEAAVARSGPYSPENLHAYLSSKQAKLQRNQPVLQDIEPNAPAPSSQVLKAHPQQEGQANFVYSSIDREGNFGLCGCWVIASVDDTEEEMRQKRDLQTARAHIQQEVLPYTFYELDQYGKLNICNCYFVPPEDGKFFLDLVP